MVRNPCNKCLVKACCGSLCEDYYKYESFKDLLLYIPNHIIGFFNYIKRDIKFMYRGEPIIIKLLLTILLVGQGFSVILLCSLVYMFIIGVIIL